MRIAIAIVSDLLLFALECVVIFALMCLFVALFPVLVVASILFRVLRPRAELVELEPDEQQGGEENEGDVDDEEDDEEELPPIRRIDREAQLQELRAKLDEALRVRPHEPTSEEKEADEALCAAMNEVSDILREKGCDELHILQFFINRLIPVTRWERPIDLLVTGEDFYVRRAAREYLEQGGM